MGAHDEVVGSPREKLPTLRYVLPLLASMTQKDTKFYSFPLPYTCRNQRGTVFVFVLGGYVMAMVGLSEAFLLFFSPSLTN